MSLSFRLNSALQEGHCNVLAYSDGQMKTSDRLENKGEEICGKLSDKY